MVPNVRVRNRETSWPGSPASSSHECALVDEDGEGIAT